MLIPSTLVLFVGALSMVVLAVTDWYVWGLSTASNLRRSRHPQPLTGLELVDLALGRLVAANEAVLPEAAFKASRANHAPVATDPDDGFKRVA